MLSTIVLVAAMASSQPIYGIAVAGDGDSLSIRGERIRLFGIDAPEFDQTCIRGGSRWACGQEAASRLANIVTGKEVRCVPVNRDVFGRIVARCTAGLIDVNRTMVALGFAVAFRKYSTDYASAEESARVNRRGMWAGTFAMPEEARNATSNPSEQRRPSSRKNPVEPVRRAYSANACAIKGNRSRRGEWIYHVPGMPYYEQTRAEEMFCTEAEARAAGYRRALVK